MKQIFLLVVLAMPFGMTRHDVDIERYRELGARQEYRCVGRYSSTPTSIDYAVGVLIAPTWVLTASHFITDTSFWKFGDNIYESKRVILHPDLKPGASERQWTGFDVALVELKTPVLDVEPAARYNGRSEVGTLVTKIGYGYVGNGLSGLITPRRQERLGGQNIIEAAGGTFEGRTFSENVLVFDFDSPDGSANKLGDANPVDLEIGGSKGDSGGGVFGTFDNKVFLIGIVSGALNREIKYGSVAALSRVSSTNQWIDSIIR